LICPKEKSLLQKIKILIQFLRKEQNVKPFASNAELRECLSAWINERKIHSYRDYREMLDV